MCGIAGIFSLGRQNVALNELKQFTDGISHRGPDGEGFWISDNGKLGFGHRRLSILDLSENGKQPMHYAEGRYTITYNGEVYNFLEIRSELKSKGYYFKSDSDTEVILAAFDAWGRDCLLRFNGMWAMAIWDAKKNELLLARDRYGIKPLYYSYDASKMFAFGSETRQFKFLQNFERRLSKDNLGMLIKDCMSLEGFGYTLFENIEQVLPGHCMTISIEKGLTQTRWWNTASNIPSIPETYEAQVDMYRELFSDACTLRMRSDVSIASALSGGLDSSSVYCMLYHNMQNSPNAYRIPPDWQKAYVASFPGTQLDETIYAKQVIDHIKGQGIFIQPDYTNLCTDLVKGVEQYDSIYSTPLFILNGIYGSMSKDRIKVSMDGHGVDEMMYGYNFSLQHPYEQAIVDGDNEYAHDIRNTYERMFGNSMLPDSWAKSTDVDSKKNSYISEITTRVKNRLLRSHYASRSWFPESNKIKVPSRILESREEKKISLYDNQLYDQFHYTILPTILRNFDRASMLNGIEIRMPFMDYRLVSFVFGLPPKSKLGHGYSKRIIRDAMKGLLPEPIRTRTFKIGLNAPMIEWFSGDLATLIADETNSKAFTQSPYWNGKVIKEFTHQRIKEKNWTWNDCIRFWPVLNAHLLLKN